MHNHLFREGTHFGTLGHKCMFLFSEVSNPSDRSNLFSRHPLTDLFILPPAIESLARNDADTILMLFEPAYTSHQLYAMTEIKRTILLICAM